MATAPSSTTPVNPDIQPVEFGAGADSLVLWLSGDFYKEDPTFRIFVDGKQLGETFAVTADHTQSEWQPFLLHGDWAAGPHMVGIEFLNDIYGGSPHADRNLYLAAVAENGAVYSQQEWVWYTNGSLGFGFLDWT